MRSHTTREFLAGCHIAQRFGRPHTPTDQAWIESLFGHVKGENPHLERITDPGELDAELARVRTEYNTIRLHASIGYVTPDDEHEGRGEAIRQHRRHGLDTARLNRIQYRRNQQTKQDTNQRPHTRSGWVSPAENAALTQTHLSRRPRPHRHPGHRHHPHIGVTGLTPPPPTPRPSTTFPSTPPTPTTSPPTTSSSTTAAPTTPPLVCTRFGGQWFRLRCLVRLFDRALNILGLSRPVSSSESWSVAVSCCSSRTRRAIERSVRRAQATAACG